MGHFRTKMLAQVGTASLHSFFLLFGRILPRSGSIRPYEEGASVSCEAAYACCSSEGAAIAIAIAALRSKAAAKAKLLRNCAAIAAAIGANIAPKGLYSLQGAALLAAISCSICDGMTKERSD